MAEFTAEAVAKVRGMGARAGDAWVRLGAPARNPFTGQAGLEPLASAWRDGYFDAAKQARAERQSPQS